VGADEAAEEGHEERRAHALVADVGDDESDPPVLEREGVVEVAADLPRRVEGRGDLPARRLGQRVGQEVLLDLPADLELPFELARVVALSVLEPLLLERGRNAGAKHDRVEGLGQVVRGAELDRAGDAVDLVDGRDHDDRNVPEHGIRPHALEDLETVHLGHHDVEEHQVDRVRGEDV